MNSETTLEVKPPSKRKPVRRVAGFAALLLAALAAVAPYVPAGVLRPHIERALERSLNRKVAVNDVRFTFFPSGPVPGPGFSLQNVTIQEDPRAGIEPFAHMEELGASVRLLSLLRGKLELSGINLGDASINLVQTATGTWNVQYLLSQADPGSAAIPAIRMRSGRVNFKFGDTKSVFYFNDADLDIAPPSSGSSYAGGMEIRFGGAPARTDHSARDFGRFFVSGNASDGYRKLDLRVEVERSSLEETLRLIDPRGFGVHGVVAMDAHLSGAPEDLKALGSLQIGDVHRWDLLPAAGGVWKIPFAGTLDLHKEQLNLLSTSEQAIQPVSVRLHAQNFLKNPDWTASVDFTKVPLVTLFEVANHMGALSPEISKLVATGAAAEPPAKPKDGAPQAAPSSIDGLKITGSVTGSAILARHTELNGKFKLAEVSLSSPGVEPLQIPEALIEMGGGMLQLLPTQIQFGASQTAELEGTSALATPRALDLKITTAGLSVDAIRALGLSALPFLESVAAKAPASDAEPAATDEKTADTRDIRGTWKGWARYSIHDALAEATDDPSNKASADDASGAKASDALNTGTWTSDAELQNASLAVDGLADPVLIQYAAIKMDGTRISLSRMRAKAGAVSFTGSYQWNVAIGNVATADDSVPERPQRFNLAIQNTDVADLERLFGPALARGRGGLLARTLRLGGAPPAPEWLKSRHTDGNVTIATLDSQDWTLRGVKARIAWNGTTVRISSMAATFDPAVLAGDLDIDVSGGSPKYHFTGTLNSVPYHGGVLDLSGTVDTFGVGGQVLLNATADASAQGRSISFAPDAEFRTISANVQLKATGTAPRWNLSNIEIMPVPATVAAGAATMTGSGISQEDGRLALELTQGTKQVRYIGTLFASPAPSK